jgi:hypothetical protein
MRMTSINKAKRRLGSGLQRRSQVPYNGIVAHRSHPPRLGLRVRIQHYSALHVVPLLNAEQARSFAALLHGNLRKEMQPGPQSLPAAPSVDAAAGR